MKNTIVNLLNIKCTKNKNQYLRLAFLMILTNLVKSCLYEKIIEVITNTKMINDNVDSINEYRNIIITNPNQEARLEEFLYNNHANHAWQNDLISNTALTEILYSIESNANDAITASRLVYPMLYSAFKNLLNEPMNNQVVLTPDSERSLLIISNIFSDSSNISYQEKLVKDKLQEWYFLFNGNGNLREFLYNLLSQSPLKAAILICTALQAGNFFCYISDFWEIFQKHISFLADESFNKFSILTDYLKTLSTDQVNNFLKNNLNDIRLEKFQDLKEALINAKYNNGNYIIDQNNNLRYLILHPTLYYGFENLLAKPSAGQLVINTEDSQSLLIISNLFSDRTNLNDGQINARNQLDQYLSETSNNFSNRANYLYNSLNQNPLQTAIIICKALKAGNYFCYISDFWDIYQNKILSIENPNFNKFSIFTDFLKNLSNDEINQCQNFLENNFSLACADRRLDFAKALLDTQNNNNQFILNHEADENLYKSIVEMINLQEFEINAMGV